MMDTRRAVLVAAVLILACLIAVVFSMRSAAEDARKQACEIYPTGSADRFACLLD